jgi:peptidoglycan/xylan/chitin deacetylase (PgdA/CDA1 family)
MNALISHLGLGLSLLTACATALATPAATPSAACKGTLYLTFDTGNMRHAELIAETLARHGVKATFFLAQEKTTSRRPCARRQLGAVLAGARRRRPRLWQPHLATRQFP